MTRQQVTGVADNCDPAAGLDLFELAATGMVVTDARGCFRRVNQAFGQMLGRDVADLIGMSFGDITLTDDVGQSRKVMRDLLTKAVPIARFEKRYVHADGSLVWVDMNIRAITDAVGEVVGFLTQGFDISSRKAAEDELRHQALLFGAINDGVFVSDAHGALVDFNPAMERLVGHTRAALPH